MKKIFVTGISTEVGKTVAAAIITEALEADYWKPVQAGDLHRSDSHKVRDLISNKKTRIHQNSYALKTPMSPHAAAAIDGVRLEASLIIEPQTENHLVIEGAGGILVPLNESETIADLLRPDYYIVLVSRHYLGSINHTLLSIQYLKSRGFQPLILFSGNEHPSTEEVILHRSGCRMIGRIREEDDFNAAVISAYADEFREALEAL